MHNDEQAPQIHLDIHRDGRVWTGDEVRERIATLMELKFEISEGKLFWDGETRLLVLGMLLENVGMDAAVRLGSLSRWKEAVATAEKDCLPNG